MYPVCENTNNFDDPSVDDVIAYAFDRASSPRESVHVDEYISDAVDQYGADSVEQCIRLILVEEWTHRQAGAEAFGAENYQWGIYVGSAVSTYLHRELSYSTDDKVIGLANEEDAAYETQAARELEYEE